jgi:colanic acid biosynthesis glycosyl transferase WcaI
MKILIYGINYAPELAGIGKYSGEMAEWLARRGNDVRVVTAPPYYPQWNVSEEYSAWRYRHEFLKGVDVWRCPLWVPGRPTGVTRILHLASFAVSSFPLMLAQVLWRPDVVIAVEPPLFCAPGAAVVARLAGSHAWLHVQDFEVDAAFELGILRSRRAQGFVRAVERWLLRGFDRISTISGRMLTGLEEKGVTDGRRVFFPNWVDTDRIFPVAVQNSFRHELRIGPREVVALYSGNMGQKQGLETLIEAARILAGTRPVRFVLCGRGAAYERLRREARGLPNVLWIALQPEERLNELLNLADIHLLPQREDAADLVMPSKLTGIMASGRPVVATAREGTEVWSVVRGRGVTVPPGDPHALASAIAELAGDPERRSRLGAEAREYAVNHLDKEKVLVAFAVELSRLALSDHGMGFPGTHIGGLQCL